MQTLRHIFSLLPLLWVALSVGAASYTPQTVPNPKQEGQAHYVCNPSGIVSPDDAQYLNQCAARLEAATGVELCVVALDAIGDYDAFDFSYELFQRWGIGKEGKNTGVLLFLALESRDVRIMTGGGIEGILTDAICKRIIETDMMPLLRQGDYSGGLCVGALRIYERCTNGEAPEELRNASSVTNRYGYTDTDEGESLWIWLLIALFIVGPLIVSVWWANRPKRCPQCGRKELRKTGSQILVAATYHHAGKGVTSYYCRHCGKRVDTPFVIPRKTRTTVSGGSGGFGGGFSGGSFGGGSTFGGGAGGKF